MAEPTQSGGADSGVDPSHNPAHNTPQRAGRDPELVKRDELLAALDAKIAERREQENRRFLESADTDPRAALLAAQLAREARSQPGDTGADGAASVEKFDEADPAGPAGDAADAAAQEAVRISHKGTDPLGEYVVRVEGKPMFKTLVDGKEVLVPLDRARTQLQKHLAADIRLQQAAERQKQLDAREQSIRNVEATLKTRSAHPSASAPVVDDTALDTEAVELVRSLVTEPEGKAAARLAKTLKSIRASAPQIDIDAITRRATDVAVQTIVARDNERAMSTGLEEFTTSYPDIASDSELFAVADRKTNAIAEEHKDWSPKQVMLEAGKQTREWLKSIGAPVKQVASGEPPSNRQARKQNLVPMPQARSVQPARPAESTEDSSPQAVMSEIRKSRGQPY
jgi:hypothetical protein